MVSRRFLVAVVVIILSFGVICSNADNGNDYKDYLTARSFGFKSSLREESKNNSGSRTISINDFGAKGNGTDDTKAFVNAWMEVCSNEGSVTLVVPKNTYLVKPVSFEGPCKSNSIRVQIRGTLEGSDDRSDYSDKRWILFHKIQGLTVEGGGTLDGKGDVWWRNSCKLKKSQPCGTAAPTALTFNSCENLVVRHLNVRNSPQMQVAFERCRNVSASNLRVTAPGNAPNTDGIHVTHSQNINISDSLIGTGDDCISIVSGSRAVRATGITCGPGHGISIGSLGAGNAEAYVADVTVDGAKFSGTTNGVRIKTWQGGSGNVSNVKFMNIEMNNVQNPIFIDQNYCITKGGCAEQSSAVKVEDVLYRNITGTSASEVAINFDCSESSKCRGIVLQDIDIRYDGSNHHHHHHGHGHDDDVDDHTNARASCKNIDFTSVGVVNPHCPHTQSPSLPPHHQSPPPPPHHQSSPPPPHHQPPPRQSPPPHHQSPPPHHQSPPPPPHHQSSPSNRHHPHHHHPHHHNTHHRSPSAPPHH